MTNAFREHSERLAGYIGLFSMQAMIAVVLYMMANFIALFAHYVVAGSIAFLLYAVSWWGLWAIQFADTGIPRFYPKLIAATIPLVAFAIFYISSRPTPNYTLMIPILPVDIHFWFSTAVTGTVLFPLYSITLAKIVLPNGLWKLRSMSAAAIVASIGVGVFESQFSFVAIWLVIVGTHREVWSHTIKTRCRRGWNHLQHGPVCRCTPTMESWYQHAVEAGQAS